MSWIEGVARSSTGKLVLQSIAADGSRREESLSALGSQNFPGSTSRIRITTDCASWTLHTAEPYWEHVGVTAHAPRDGHATFLLTSDGRKYLIPASVFIASMMRPIQYVHRFLFSPQGLDAFSMPILGGTAPTIGLHLPAHKIFGTGARTPDSLRAAYSWMHCFPSARRMWDSVYAFALDGRLDITPPDGHLTMTVHSVVQGAYQLVTSMVILSITTDEAPFCFAANHPQTVALHAGSGTIDWSVAHHPACGVAPRHDGEWSLSDEEWNNLLVSIKIPPRPKFDSRRIIDKILLKLGTGTAWRKLDYDELNFSTVQTTYQRMQQDGRWPEVETLLARSRRQALNPVRRCE